jgi:tetratricopeptide (TPR) repeat protein
MTDPRSTSTALPGGPDATADRDARIDELLLAGLDHYFAGQYQDAINVWERVLFLDRSHARARAYIERARGAIAERQRKSEQLVQEGVEALSRGDEGVARELLSSAVDHGDAHETAQAYLDRIERLSAERAAQVRESRTRRLRASGTTASTGGLLTVSRRPVRALPIIGLALVAAAIILFATSKDPLKPFLDLELSRPAGLSPAARPPEPLPVPRAAELALSRARSMFAAGQLKAALAELDLIADADPLSGEADRLRATVQRVLLGLPQSPGKGTDAAVAAEPPGSTSERRE